VPQSASSMRMRSSSGVPSHLSPPPFTSSFSSLSPYAAQPCRKRGMAPGGRRHGSAELQCRWRVAAAREGATAPSGQSGVWRGGAASGKGGVGMLWRGTLPARGACGAGAGSCRCRKKLHSPRANEGEQHPVFDSVRLKSFTYSVSL
jgi:hypothetical protein